MENLFLAKSNPKETIQEHTENLLREYERLRLIYPNIKNINWDLLRLACLYHDLGKMNTKFQNKIIENINKSGEVNNRAKIKLLKDELKEIDEIPHGYLSNAFIPIDYLEENFLRKEIKILYESIFYHHNREKLEGNRKIELMKVIREDLEKYKNNFKYNKLIKNNIELSTGFTKYLKSRVLVDYLDSEKDINFEDASKFIMTKGLLNKIDFAASSDVNVEIKPGELEKLTVKSIEPYKLNDLQRYMRSHQEDNLVIKASTGIGKTEGALIWIGNNKGFFTLPLKVAINSVYDRVIEKINYGNDKTALLHSDSASEYMKRSEEGVIDKEYLDSTKQLSFPLTICTLDQLISFIFKYEGFELKLATLSYSKIVIDEIQMYSPDMIAYLILALREIILMGGKFAIVTATFPPIFEYFMNYVGIESGKMYKTPEKPFLKKQDRKIMLRHKVRVFEENINSKIIYKSFNNQKVLVIVNTIKAAQDLYNQLALHKDLEGKIFMFHSRYIKEDRTKKETKIFKDGQLKNDFKGIWITTQVVEASLDIDFDVLFTELSDISGLLQRMGRVFRNRILCDDIVNINIFVGNEKRPSGISLKDSIIDIDIFEKSKEVIMKYDNMKLDEEEKMKIVDEVYSVQNLKNSNYFSKIKKTICDFKDIIPYDLKKNEEKLRDISSENVIPKCIYEKNKEELSELIKKLKIEKDFSKRIYYRDEIMKKTVSINSKKINNMKRNNTKVEELEISKFNKIYIVPGRYTLEKGLEYEEELNGFSENQIL
ncbi:CRISPR-associated helicase/endonuclease Cas3 [Clostridium carnis]